MARILTNLGTVVLCGLPLVGCEINSSNTVTRTVGVDVSGVYRHPNAPAENLVSENSGAPVTSLDLRQSGDMLEAQDNNGIAFVGTIGNEDGTTASLTLEGRTTAGNSATISGAISVAGATATMRGTWIEPDLYGTVYGTATVSTNQQPTEPFYITPSSATISVNSSKDFTIIGGWPGGDVTWSDHNIGKLEMLSDNAARYTAYGTPGTNTITATASDGRTATATVIQQ